MAFNCRFTFEKLGQTHILVESDSIFLSTRGTNRYFKVTSNIGNEGHDMLEFLNSKGINPKTVFDVGANFGEISLFFCRKLPDAKIVAIEASPENLEILRYNMAKQYFNTDNIKIVPKAVSDKNGFVHITCGLGSENTIMEQSDDSVNVPCDKLDSIINSMGINQIDFMKIDIEGAEPLLKESLCASADKIRSLFIEFSNKNNQENYISLMKGLCNAGYTIYFRYTDQPLSFEEASKLYSKRKGDFWFVKEGHESQS